MTCGVPEDPYLGWESTDRHIMTRLGQTQKRALDTGWSHTTSKVQVTIATWNVLTLNKVGKTAQVTTEMRKYAINILGISECRWTGFGQLITVTGDTILYSTRVRSTSSRWGAT